MMERLTKRTDNGDAWYNHRPDKTVYNDDLLQRLAYYEDMEEQGRLVVPIVRVGDTVWTNIAVQGDRYRKADRPYQVKVIYIGIGTGNAYFHVEYSNGRVFPFDFNKIGKTVFLTREDAEQALKGGADNG